MIDDRELISGLNSAIDRLLNGEPPVAVEEDADIQIRPYVEIFALLLEDNREPARPEFRAALRARFVAGAEMPPRHGGALSRVAALVGATFILGSAVNPVLARNLVTSIGETMGSDVADAVARLLDTGPGPVANSPQAGNPGRVASNSPIGTFLDPAPGETLDEIRLGDPETVPNTGDVPVAPAAPPAPPVSASAPIPADPAADEPRGKPSTPPAPAVAPPTQHVPPAPPAGPAEQPPNAGPVTTQPTDPVQPAPPPADPPASTGESPAQPSPAPSPEAPGNGKGNAHGIGRGNENGQPPADPGKSVEQSQEPPSPGAPDNVPDEASQAADVRASGNASQELGPPSRPDAPAVEPGPVDPSEAPNRSAAGKAQPPNFPAA